MESDAGKGMCNSFTYVVMQLQLQYGCFIVVSDIFIIIKKRGHISYKLLTLIYKNNFILTR